MAALTACPITASTARHSANNKHNHCCCRKHEVCQSYEIQEAKPSPEHRQPADGHPAGHSTCCSLPASQHKASAPTGISPVSQHKAQHTLDTCKRCSSLSDTAYCANTALSNNTCEQTVNAAEVAAQAADDCAQLATAHRQTEAAPATQTALRITLSNAQLVSTKSNSEQL